MISPSFYGRCAKEIQFKGSTKIKKKKRKDKEKSNNSAVNEAFEGEDDEKHSSQNRPSLTPLLESGDLKKDKTRSVITETKTDGMTGMKKCQKGNDIEKRNGCVTNEEELSRGNFTCSSEGLQRKFSRQGSLVTAMIYDLQREDTIIEKTLTAETPLDEGAHFKHQVTSTSVSVSVVISKGVQKEKVQIGEGRVSSIGHETMKRNCDVLLTRPGDTENVFQKTKPKRKNAVTQNCYKDQNHFLSNDLKETTAENVKQNDGNTTQDSNSSFSDRELEKVTICCFQWQPSSSNSKAKEESEGASSKKAEPPEADNKAKKTEKVSFLARMKRKVTKRKVMAALCPCFTYFILEGEHGGNPIDKAQGETDKNPQEIHVR